MNDIKQSNAYRQFDELSGKLKVLEGAKQIMDAVIGENEQLKQENAILQTQIDTLALEILTLLGV